MNDLRRHSLLTVLTVLSLGLSSVGALSACKGGPRTPESEGYKVKVNFRPAKAAKGATLPAVRPEDVQVVETMKNLPTGVHFGQGVTLAQDFPSPEEPHRDVGWFYLRESIDYQLDVLKDPAFTARRNDILKKEAAQHGANRVFLFSEQFPGRGVRNVEYFAISLSSAAPAYPSAEDVLRELKLKEDGFVEVHRFTASVADFGGRKPEPTRFKAGHTYMFAVVFRPGPVELGMAERESLAFLVNVDNDPVLQSDRQGSFSERTDKRYDPDTVIPGVDGVFARGGAGTMEGRGRSVKVEFVSRSATVRLAKLHNIKGSQPLGPTGAGEADFIVFERKVGQDELVDEVCSFCRNAALSCNKRAPLSACEELRACFKQIEQPSSLCTAAYKDL